MLCTLRSYLIQLQILAVSILLLTAPAHAQTSFQAHTVTQASNLLLTTAKGDFNGDGREDLLVEQFAVVGGNATNLLYLSSGDGTYQAPRTLPIGVGGAMVGDFNNDGKLDIAGFATTSNSQLQILLGNGDGTFQAPKAAAGIGLIVAADLNHDNKTDLVQAVGFQTIQVWLSNGDGTFTAGQKITNTINYNILFTGDFDGDGKPDVALVLNEKGQSIIQIYYGDGAGHLGSPYTFADPNNYEDSILAIADANNDGRSDFITAPFTYGVSGTSVFYPKLRILYGNANRTLSFQDYVTTGCPSYLAGVADFTGDGLNDLIFNEAPCSGGGSDILALKPGTGSNSFGAEQTIYQDASYSVSMQGLEAGFTLRSSQGTRPDIVFTQPTSAPNPSKFPATNLVLLSNSSTGAFPGCGIKAAEGLAICSPGTTASSPVRFSFIAAGPTPMRTAAVWVDGVKKDEQLAHAFSNYSFLDASLPLSNGSHSIALFGTGWDNTIQKRTFTLNVGNTTTCQPPATDGVNVCSPLQSSTVSSPVQVMATARITGTLARMEVWVDGVKKFTETTSTSFTTSIALASGSHTFAVFAVNTAGTKWLTRVTATVK